MTGYIYNFFCCSGFFFAYCGLALLFLFSCVPSPATFSPCSPVHLPHPQMARYGPGDELGWVTLVDSPKDVLLVVTAGGQALALPATGVRLSGRTSSGVMVRGCRWGLCGLRGWG